jgi:hypothetical protein
MIDERESDERSFWPRNPTISGQICEVRTKYRELVLWIGLVKASDLQVSLRLYEATVPRYIVFPDAASKMHWFRRFLTFELLKATFPTDSKLLQGHATVALKALDV